LNLSFDLLSLIYLPLNLWITVKIHLFSSAHWFLVQGKLTRLHWDHSSLYMEWNECVTSKVPWLPPLSCLNVKFYFRRW
jgi:hypothetical protein